MPYWHRGALNETLMLTFFLPASIGTSGGTQVEAVPYTVKISAVNGSQPQTREAHRGPAEPSGTRRAKTPHAVVLGNARTLECRALLDGAPERAGPAPTFWGET
jgi:hypothetical protein